MYKALVAGCGNIGAMYDWDTEQVLTHAKAFYRNNFAGISFFDIDKAQAARVAERYSGKAVSDLDEELANTKYDIISICTPTNRHFDLLQKAIQCHTPVIICEKPVSVDLNEIEQLHDLFLSSGSKILVNYIRRFQPAYHQLRNIIADFGNEELLTNVSIRYQRGFMNNCSHAFDLLQFLFKKPFAPDKFVINRKDYDHFKTDPTISGYGEWLNANINVLGLQSIGYSHFEIDLYFKQNKIQIRDAGNSIDFFTAPAPGEGNLLPLIKEESMAMRNCVENYMLPVAAKAIALLEDDKEDNRMEALQLNRTILNILNS